MEKYHVQYLKHYGKTVLLMVRTTVQMEAAPIGKLMYFYIYRHNITEDKTNDQP